jgi:hypothetical protein
MRIAEAERVIRAQTIPALKSSGGSGHVEALEEMLAEVDRLRDGINMSDDTFDGQTYWSAVRILTARAELAEAENTTLRKLLWIRHTSTPGALYGDDGEMQCGECGIDFKRLPAAEIDRLFYEAGLRKLAAALPLGHPFVGSGYRSECGYIVDDLHATPCRKLEPEHMP